MLSELSKAWYGLVMVAYGCNRMLYIYICVYMYICLYEVNTYIYTCICGEHLYLVFASRCIHTATYGIAYAPTEIWPSGFMQGNSNMVVYVMASMCVQRIYLYKYVNIHIYAPALLHA